jgi:hypothetical protein
MALPRYTAEVSLYRTSKPYRVVGGARGAIKGGPMIVAAQSDPCAIRRPRDHRGQTGGGTQQVQRCPPGYRCCGPSVGGFCSGLCVPSTSACP